MTATTRRVTATLPKELVDAAEATLRARGSNLTDFIRMSFRTLAKLPVVVELGDELTFGKYKGEILETVIRTTPDYIAWLLNTSGSFVMSDEAKALYESVYTPPKKQKRRQPANDPAQGDLLTITTQVSTGG